MFRHRLQRRCWAALVLALWLFGVGVGVAHACLAPGALQPVGPVAAHLSVGDLPHAGPDQAAADGDAHCQPGQAAHSNCQDFCDKARVSVPTLKSALDAAQGHALSLLAVAVVLPVSAHEPVPWLAPRRDGVRAPPIPIAFLRLAL